MVYSCHGREAPPAEAAGRVGGLRRLFNTGLAHGAIQEEGPVEGRPISGDTKKESSVGSVRWGSLPAPAFSTPSLDRCGAVASYTRCIAYRRLFSRALPARPQPDVC